MKNQPTQRESSSPASSWAQWFDRCAEHYQDPRMKMAYYKDGATGEPVEMETLRAIHEDVWKKLRATPQSTLLDVGSGIGLFAQSFQNRLRRVVGTDISFNMVKDAAALNPRGTFLQCDVSSLPFVSKTFERLLCYSVFHYLHDDNHARQTIDEFRRVVKKNGLILIGDLLYPSEIIQKKVSSPNASIGNPDKAISGPPIKTFGGDNSKKDNKPSSPWWPSSLNHQLQKKTFPPPFFQKYAWENGLSCEILTQEIKGKDNSRYDVAIKV